MDIAFILNGEAVELRDVDPQTSVLDWLREVRGLTGTREGCNEGDCGACSVLVSDAEGSRALSACLMFLPQLNGRTLTTVEGLAGPGGQLHPVQQALIDHHASLCGFCAPGIAISLAAGQIAGETDHVRQLTGNLCRCTGYTPALKAAKAAAEAPVPDWLAGLGAAPAPDCEPELPDTAEALAAYLTRFPNARIVAGGTDIAPRVNTRMEDLGRMVFIDRIEEMRRIETARYMLRIGAAATIEDLRLAMAPLHPDFADMLARFGSPQVRAAATVGGNIANGSPIGDTPPPLIALGAVLLLRRGDATRELPLEDFFLDYGRQDLHPGEFIEAITVPREPGEADRLRVYKLSKRMDQDISTVLGAFNIEVNAGRVTTARIVYGGMAATPKRARAMETALTGKAWTRETVELAKARASQDFAPLSDHRGSRAYRLAAAANMLLRYWLEDQGARVRLSEVSA
ncbi:MAG: xanthine dehydrogenase small subunit [Rhodobacterales bacterium]|nr:MAG: xanthine dehydrogenase small subunit [Rhodobacterales bacterium]